MRVPRWLNFCGIGLAFFPHGFPSILASDFYLPISILCLVVTFCGDLWLLLQVRGMERRTPR